MVFLKKISQDYNIFTVSHDHLHFFYIRFPWISLYFSVPLYILS